MPVLTRLKESKQIRKIRISLIIALLAFAVTVFTGCGGGSRSGNSVNNPQPQPQSFSVSFITNGGSSVMARSAQQCDSISAAPETTREGYSFDG